MASWYDRGMTHQESPMPNFDQATQDAIELINQLNKLAEQAGKNAVDAQRKKQFKSMKGVFIK